MSVVGERLDLAAFVRYIAAQDYVAQNDGFLGYAGMNNFYFYRLEGSAKHVFLAWDEDNAFFGPDFSLTSRHDENVLMRKAMQIPELRDIYFNTLRDAMASADEVTGDNGLRWLEYEMRREMDLLEDSIREDQFKPYSVVDHDNSRNAMIDFSQNRSRYVRENLPQ
jgi:hypothetical protein